MLDDCILSLKLYHNKYMLWKLYAWVYVVMTFIGFVLLVPLLASWDFTSWEGAVETVVLAIGALSYSYHRSIFTKRIWQIIFAIIILIWTVDVVYYTLSPSYLSFLGSGIAMKKSEVFLTMFLSIPALIAVYKLGFARWTPGGSSQDQA